MSSQLDAHKAAALLADIDVLAPDLFFANGSTDPVNVVMSYADRQENKLVRIGWPFDESRKRTVANEKLGELVLAVLHVAACGFYLNGCIGARIGNGVSILGA